jgi:DNA topoisomerase-1
MRAASRIAAPGASPAIKESVADARAAGLRYGTDAAPGITRVGTGRTFRYLFADGRPVRDRKTLERIRKLVIPPAYRDVWISADPLSHLQATGRDARGRKQYRYHERWRAVRDETKFDRMLAFSKLLPGIRRRIDSDLAQKKMTREKILATLVHLLDNTHIRVGNEEYARSNKSHGLTTLRNKHVRVRGDNVVLEFKGKRGKLHRCRVTNRRVARVMSHCLALPGEQLFQYVDGDGNLQPLDSGDVNDYLRELTGENITAKDFRTWAGTVAAAEALLEAANGAGEEDAAEVSVTERQRILVAAIDAVAKRLNNTRAVCRKYYIHPRIIECHEAGTLASVFAMARGSNRRKAKGLSELEAALVRVL